MLLDGYLHGERHAGGPPDDRRRCPRCGATNGPEFRYCRRCVTRIG